jgi:hypothetical protein
VNQSNRQPSLLRVGWVKEHNGFKVSFLMQKESGSDGAAFPRAKCVV